MRTLFIASFKETPEPFPLPTEASIVRAAAGWAHCVSVTGNFLLGDCPFSTCFGMQKLIWFVMWKTIMCI